MKVTKRGASVKKAQLLVIDSDGFPVPGAVVDFTWSHIVDFGAAPSFTPWDQMLTTTLSKRPSKQGLILANSPLAKGGHIRLTVNAVYLSASSPYAKASPSKDPPESAYWNKDASDVVRDFYW